MTQPFLLFIPILVVSLITNVGLVLKLSRQSPTRRTQSLELQEFLVDLLSGPGMVAIARVDPNSILLRSPKQK